MVDVTLSTEAFARCVHFDGINEGCAEGTPVVIEDSYFDMRAGETKTIRMKSDAAINTDSMKVDHWLTEWN